ncbi:MAG: replication factor C small subunit [Candidatus Hermodarchaeia archaeon]|jgi:replication factor C small subunit
MSEHWMWTEKYRPKKLKEIIGQKPITDRLQKFLIERELPHLLFSGPAGTGKTTAIIAFANELFGDNFTGNFLELNASDERGIDVVRNRVKSFARTRPLGDVPFKIISLDEADSLTRDAQHALRRTMERYVTSCRFCLICNYSSRIIDPIQSRCAIFRFPRLGEKELTKRINHIAKKEEVQVTDDGIQAILYVSGGDLRRAINVLQAASVTQNQVDADAVFSTTGKARPEDVNQMLQLALNGKFLEAQEKLRNLLIWQGLAGTDIVKQIHREVMNLGINEMIKVQLIDLVGEAEFRLTEGADPEIQLSHILAKFALLAQSSDSEK